MSRNQSFTLIDFIWDEVPYDFASFSNGPGVSSEVLDYIPNLKEHVMETIENDAKIASNLVALAEGAGIPVPFCQADIDNLRNDKTLFLLDKANQMRKIKAAIHEFSYAPLKK